MSEAGATTPRIVVGVDGSDNSIEALRWAARQAELTGAQLNVVTAWSYPEFPTPFGIVPELPLPHDPLAAPRVRLVEAIASALGDRPRIAVEPRVVEGPPPVVLLDAAAGAELLVVGSRGLGGMKALLLGSVSERCVRHASCPVVVIHHTTDHGDLKR
jgi:nucleotide-binding universal stress UspA family protein